MSKKLLVKTPHTVDGKTLQYDENKQVVYRKSIVELSARKNLESLNASLPKHLRNEFEVIDVEDQTAQSASNEELKKKLAELEAEKENKELKKRIAELEAEKEASAKKGAEEAEAAAKVKADEEAIAKAKAEKEASAKK
jgi:hypothetical protein